MTGRPSGPGGARPSGPGMGMRGPGGAGPGLRPGGTGRPMGAPPPPPPVGGGLITRRKKADEGSEEGQKKKPAGKGVKKARTVEVDNELFTKGPFSGTQIINEDLGPDIVMPEIEEEGTAQPKRQHARKQPNAGNRTTLELTRPTGKVALTEGVTVKELAEKLQVKANDLMPHLMTKNGIMAAVNQPLGRDLTPEIAQDLGI